MTEDDIKFNQDKTSVKFKGVEHLVSFGGRFSPNTEFTIATYSFSDEKGKESDGCVFEIKPEGSTRVMMVISKDLSCQRIAIKGSGWFLGVSPEGDVVHYRLDSKKEENPQFELHEGWVDCFIAGDEGMEVADVSTPQFNPEMEREIMLDSSELPPEFWKLYKELKHL